MADPWCRFEDDHVLVVSKPAGVNTHRADVDAQEGMYEWVQRQRPGVSLSILHRLDKGTSGLLLFGKSTIANQRIGQQFADRKIAKQYSFIADHPGGGALATNDRWSVDDPVGGSRRDAGTPSSALTDFVTDRVGSRRRSVLAHPHTGRTHQVRVHATASGVPIIGDVDHDGPEGTRLHLHSARLAFEHPVDGRRVALDDPPPPSFDRLVSATESTGALAADAFCRASTAAEARQAIFDPAETDCYLWIDRHHDGFADLRVERLGDVGLALHYSDDPSPFDPLVIDALVSAGEISGLHVQQRPRQGATSPATHVAGRDLAAFPVRELGHTYLIDLAASPTSSGLFLDQRETRRRLAAMPLAGRTMLNAFAHTGSLSVAAASAGAETLTLDLSTRYLDWARENLRVNDIDPADHDFIYGDALDWMERLAKKGRTFDVVVVDPPSASTARSSSRSKKATRWTVARDLHALVQRSADLTAPGGTMFVSTNLRKMRWEQFLDHCHRGLADAGRTGAIETQTVPIDHRIGPGEVPHLKGAWIVLDGND